MFGISSVTSFYVVFQCFGYFLKVSLYTVLILKVYMLILLATFINIVSYTLFTHLFFRQQ